MGGSRSCAGNVGESRSFVATQDECGRVAHTPLREMWASRAPLWEMWAGRPSLLKMRAGRPPVLKMWAGRPHSYAENVGGSPTLLR